MTLATRCGRCRTVFRLDQAALNAAEGWVRCGQCRDVFNAIETLFEPKPAVSGAELVAAIDAARFEGSVIGDAQAIGDDRAVSDAQAVSDVLAIDDAPDIDHARAAADAAADTRSNSESSPEPLAATAGPVANDVASRSTVEAASSPVDGSITSHTASETAPSGVAPPAGVLFDATPSDMWPSDATPPDNAPSEAPPDNAASDVAPTVPTALADEDDARDLRAARMSLFGPDSQFDDDSRFDTQVGDDGLERMSLWSDTRPAPPRRRTRRARPKAAAHRDDRDFELSETTVDVAGVASVPMSIPMPVSIPMPMPSVEAVDHLIASNDRDTTFAEYEPTSGYEISTRPAHRRRPSMRLALRVAAITLGVGLMLQSVLHARDSIAAHWPSTEPALQRLCAPFGCDVEAPRDLQALQVQSVTFQETGVAGLYDLNVVLFNRSDLRIRMPALDLRISDARGTVAARRVLTAAEMEVRERSIAPRSEAALAVNLRIDHPTISGYEVTVFYP